jgi:endonuclease G
MPGYDENFLSVKVPLPTPSRKLRESYLNKPKLRNGVCADYLNYTVVTDKDKRAPIYAALNIDQNLMRKTKRKSTWLIDQNIGKEFQLDNEYYKDRGKIKNPYDKGHLAMREQAGWGTTTAEAQAGADDTFYYSNASLQHGNFNKDEWYGLEEWVGDLDLDLDGKISCFSGPIYGSFSRTVRPPALEPAEVPAGFFKIVFFINKQTKQLDVRAFMAMQDQEAIADREGRKMYNAQNYQTTVREIS